MIAEKSLPQDIPSDGGQLLFVFLDSGELDLPFAFDRRVGHRRIQENVSQNLNAETQIGLRHVKSDAEAIVPGIARDSATNRFDGLSDFFGSARPGSLQE